MILYRSIDEISAPLCKAVVTIGNFDGVHLGHREIFRRLKSAARLIDGVSVVITFHPHPLHVIDPSRRLTLINTLDEKITLIEASGVDYLIVIPFTQEFASIDAADFVEKILVARIGMKKIIIGYDYAFGKGRVGNSRMLESLGKKLLFEVEELSPINTGDTVYSSSLVRKMIREGKVSDVVRFLGRHFSLAGYVVHGAHRGKTLGFPTANISTDKELLPADGVYAVKVKIDDRLYDAACNIGSNPTFGTAPVSIEVFILDFSMELYDSEIRVYFIERIREEKRFRSVEELKEAIADDVARCRLILESTPLVIYREYLEGV
jgi:riboflavin kinase / FMN adenylyltransferase